MSRCRPLLTTLLLLGLGLAPGLLTGCDVKEAKAKEADAPTPKKVARLPESDAPGTGTKTPPVAVGTVSLLPREERPSQSQHGRLVRDEDYAFSLRLPGPRWEFWDEERVRSLNPDATMGFVNLQKQGFALVITERLGDLSLDDFVNLILDNQEIPQRVIHSQRSKTIGGQPGIEVCLSGVIRGVHLEYVLHFVTHRGFHYQVLGWSLPSHFPRVQPELTSLVNSLEFLDQEPRLRDVGASLDDQDVDWRIRDGHYENASFGFRLVGTEGWRFAGSSELAQMNSDASAGLVCSDPQIYQIYVVEPVGDVDRAEHTRIAHDLFAQNLNLTEEPSVRDRIVVAGIEALEARYDGVEVSGASFDMVLTTLYRDSIFYQIQSWWPTVERRQALATYHRSYQALSFLEEREQRELQRELRGHDVNNAVGAEFSYRGGVYRDFLHGFTYRIPVGIWRAKVGDLAHTENAEADLILESPARGVFLAVIPEIGRQAGEAVSNRVYHERVISGMAAPEDTVLHDFPRPQGDLVWSTFDLTLDGLDFRYVCITGKAQTRHVQLLAYGLRQNLPEVDLVVREVTAGLSIAEKPTPASSSRQGAYEDQRLGFRLDPGTNGWKLKAPRSMEVRSISSQATARKGNTVCVALGVCEVDLKEEIVLQSLLESEPVRKLAVDSRTRNETQDTLAGLPAKRMSFTARDGMKTRQLDIWIARRANTLYCYLVSQERGWLGGGENAESLKEFFSLVD